MAGETSQETVAREVPARACKGDLDQGGGGRDREVGGCERYSGREGGREEGGLKRVTPGVLDPTQQRKAEWEKVPDIHSTHHGYRRPTVRSLTI